MKVLSVGYPFAPVRADTAGGAEQVLLQLDRALVSGGHESLVVAAAGSTISGRLFSLSPRSGPVTQSVKSEVWRETRDKIECVLAAAPVDVVHMHGIDFREYLPVTNVPVLVTLHLPPSWYSPASFCLSANVFLHCVSDSQQADCRPVAQLLPPISNGVALDWFRPSARKRGYLVALGRICFEKGMHLALDASAATGVPVLIAGEVYPYEAHQSYFQNEIQPRLDRQRRLIGPIGPERKRRLLAGARCVLIPSLALETSSLVAMEALACGTPVIALPSGALADLIVHGETGFLVNNLDEMVQAIPAIGTIDPRACRRYAEEHFDLRESMSKYMEVYSWLSA